VTFEGYSGAVQSNMRKMNAIDPNFTADSFLEGAKSAFEMIIEACRDQDHDTLKMLLSPALYDTFARELDAQVVRGEKSENTLIAIRKTEITEATLNGTKAEITVAFTSDQIQLVKNSEGDIIEGDSSQEVETDDIGVLPATSNRMIPTGASFARNFYGLVCLALLLTLTACQSGDPYKVNLRAVSYDALPGWQEDHHAKAFTLFAESCDVNARRGNAFVTKTEKSYASPEAWKSACNAARHLPNPTDEEAKNYFETHFTPYRATTDVSTRGLTTGYYEPLLHGSKKPSTRFHVPVYGVPYKPEHRNMTREKIEAGGLKGKAPILLYVDDPAMLFFLHIQGSGKVRMTDGSLVGWIRRAERASVCADWPQHERARNDYHNEHAIDSRLVAIDRKRSGCGDE